MIQSKRVLVVVLLVMVIFGGALGFAVFADDVIPPEVTQRVREVSVASVGELNNTLPSLPTIGTVESQTEAVLRTETSGEVRGVYVSQGQFVQAGTVIAELANSAERARLLQAEAGVETAEAALEKIRAGARGEDISILEARVQKETQSLLDARDSAVDALNTAFANIEGVLFGTVDQLFSDPRTFAPRLLFYADDANDLEWRRVIIGGAIEDWSESLSEVTPDDDIEVAIDTADKIILDTRRFVTRLSAALNTAPEDGQVSDAVRTGWKTGLANSQSAITASINLVSGAENALTAQQAAITIAQEELARAKSGERSEDVVAAEARVRQAEAALAEVRALFAKTQVRTPISGTVNELFIERGDFASAFSEAAIISNNNALQVTTFITEDERPFIVEGASVRIDSQYDGVVTAIAPALDSRTKKIEVTIGFIDEANLTNGESVRLSIARSNIKADTTAQDITLPLSALKIRPGDTVVFTVAEDGLVAHPVILGPIVGDRVVVLSGVTADMEVVLDARGLEEGDEVTRKDE